MLTRDAATADLYDAAVSAGAEPGAAAVAVDLVAHRLVLQGRAAHDEVLAVGARPVGLDHRRVERGVRAGQARIHQRHVVARHAERAGDLLVEVGLAAHPLRPLRQPRPQPPQVEEQGLLRRGGAAADDRPVAQDVVLDGGADPPGGIGGKAHLALRLEAGRRLQEPDMALLDEIAHRQAEMAEARGDGDDEAHMGRGQAVQRLLVLPLLPAHGELVFLLPVEIGRLHRRPNDVPPRAARLRHGLVSARFCPAPPRLRGAAARQ